MLVQYHTLYKCQPWGLTLSMLNWISLLLVEHFQKKLSNIIKLVTTTEDEFQHFRFWLLRFVRMQIIQTANIFGRDWKCRKIDESLHFPGLEPWLTALRGFLCDDVEVDVEADVGAPDEFRPFRVSMSRRAAILRCPKKTLSLAHSTPSLSLTCQCVGNFCYDS